MRVLVVVESAFGNTREVAEAIANGLGDRPGGEHATVVEASVAPVVLPDGLELLLVGAPTHGFTLPTPKSREQATAKGAPDPTRAGVREWVGQLAVTPGLRVITFDTSVELRFSPGCAANAARRLLRRRGFTDVERGPSFFVTGTPGPLADGELQRAADWARQLGAPALR